VRGKRVRARRRKPVVRAAVLASRRKRRKAAAKALATILTVAGLFLGGRYLLFSSTLFALSEVVVEGPSAANAPQAQSLQDKIKGRLGGNWLFAKLAKARQIASENPEVRVLSVERQFPGKVVVKLENRKPFAVLDLGPLFLVDEEGVVFAAATPAKAESLGLPRILGRAPVVVGEPIQDARLRASLRLLHAAQEKGWTIRRLVVQEDRLEASGETPILFGPGDASLQLADLDAARQEIRQSGLLALRYDLRFKDQIVVSIRDTAASNQPGKDISLSKDTPERNKGKNVPKPLKAN
jgi:cell division protein FtsQ